MLLDVLAGTPPYNWLQFGGSQTLDSYNFSGDLKVIPDEHVDFIQNCLDAWETDSFLFTHGNYLADRSLRVSRLKSFAGLASGIRFPNPIVPGKSPLSDTPPTRPEKSSIWDTSDASTPTATAANGSPAWISTAEKSGSSTNAATPAFD